MVYDRKQVKVVIIGAGIGGIATGINLRRKLNFHDFTIYEEASDVGGTWRDNTYPGCGCDVPVHWYSLSSELNPGWPHHYADQPTILNYWRELAVKHQLYHYIVFNTRVVAMTWDADEQAWNIELETRNLREGTSRPERVTAQLVVTAIGGLVVPKYSDLGGMEEFQGQMFHSARWNHGVQFQGKRVGVIGNGCSASQFVPKISEDSSVQVINFCRTANWFIPRLQYQYTARARWMFRYIPLTARIHRTIIATISDFQYWLWPLKNSRSRAAAEREMLNYMRKIAPEKYHEQLTPNYPFGCKRLIVDPGYLAALHRPNVQLEWGGVKRIVKDGLITNDGKKHDLDIIVYGTGFDVLKPNIHTIGRDGKSLQQYYISRGGPEAYLGTTVPGFPNLFSILGPNTASGHASALFSEELQIDYALQLMRPIIEGKAKSLEVRLDVAEAYNDDLQQDLRKTVWVSCRSFYRAGTDNMGKIIATFPGPVAKLWYLTRRVRWRDYVAIGAEQWERERRRKMLVKCAAYSVMVAMMCMAMRERRRLASVLVRFLGQWARLRLV